MFLQCQVSMSTTAPAPVGHGSLTITRPRGTCLGLATRVWGHVACAGRGVTGLDWVLLCSVVFGADSSVAGPHRGVGGTQPPPPPPQLAGPTSNIWRAPAFLPSLPGLRTCWTSGPASTSPATLMSLWPVLASLSLFN